MSFLSQTLSKYVGKNLSENFTGRPGATTFTPVVTKPFVGGRPEAKTFTPAGSTVAVINPNIPKTIINPNAPKWVKNEDELGNITYSVAGKKVTDKENDDENSGGIFTTKNILIGTAILAAAGGIYYAAKK